MAGLLVRMIGWYRSYISPARPPACRFAPTCSEYAIEALTDRGIVVGLGLTAWRLLRCGPWSAGGWDPVPPRAVHPSHVYEGAPR
ncbi:MAG: membrane protein insertion efficiency factor YidD [Segniliparus sp.]|uniref:membrane protein insertion efficiency factor YidD n=1 Tax=Segniliparus sp. TaxID=2804064 RepID=UPI003F306C08